MKCEWKTVKLGDIAEFNKYTYSVKDEWKFVHYLDTGNITENKIEAIQYIDLIKESLPSRAKRKVKNGNIIYSTVRPNQLHYGYIKEQPNNFLVSTGFAVIIINEEFANSKFIYYFLTQNNITDYLHSIAEQSFSAYPSIKSSDLADVEINLPDLETQKKIAKILSSLDDKIECNNQINKNLEEQVNALFSTMFGYFIDNLNNSSVKLGEIIESIDNRGKTPPLSDIPTEYPIIDVKALSGKSRIINYDNCTKYVTQETYNQWFRNGHPQEYDILISTVGSLAEVKLFLGNIGCIAQNVVGFRSKNISPLYLYQYLKYIKNDLVSYNIGSVQPSIKVTHIMQHPIYIAPMNEMSIFDEFARYATKFIYDNCREIGTLTKIRNVLLPKLMSGEFDVSEVEI